MHKKGTHMTPKTTKRTQAKQATPKPAQASPKEETAPKTRQEFNPTQLLMVDAVSDMLTHGGHEEDIDMLVEATMRHLEHRDIDELFSDEPEEREEIIERRVESGFDKWK